MSMATIRDAIAAYSPQLDLQKPVSPDELGAFLSEHAGVDAAQTQQVVSNLSQAILWFLVRGRPVEFPGTGNLRPTIDLHGRIGAAFEIDPALAERMSAPDAYRAGITRRENIGVSTQRLAQMWNASHPSDPVTDMDPYAVQTA
jgi:hypothetical protein